MALFDAQSFLSSALTAPSATRRDPLPAGETYGQITKQEMVTGEKDGQAWYKLNVTIAIQDQDFLQRASREKASITYGLMLDVTDAGTLAMGPNKNVGLGRLREATNTNQPGKSLQDMVGQYVRVQIGHRPDKNDPEVVYDDVKAVAKFG